MAGETVLIVDDNAVNLKLARVVLSSAGYLVHTAVDAEEALEMLETLHPALILMDLQLPGLDGLSLTRHLKADETRRSIKIIALTAYAMKGDDDKAYAAGCDDYVTKPFDPEELVAAVARHLKG